MSKEFYKKYRPQKLSEVLGQVSAINTLRRQLESNSLPHTLLLTGPSGSGKTTIARILSTHLKCSEHDFTESNGADFRGVESIRDIRRGSSMKPLGGPCRIYYIDECHKLTNEAQNAFLKMLEDTPDHIYFILATTEPQKLLKTVLGRCNEIKLVPIKPEPLTRIIKDVSAREKLKISEDVIDEIVDAADGSARKALVILDAVSKHTNEADQLKALQFTTLNKDIALDLARLLIITPRPSWSDAAKLLRSLSTDDAESIRYCILGFARSCMIGKGDKAVSPRLAARAYQVIDIFAANFYDSKQAGLAAACWEVINAG